MTTPTLSQPLSNTTNDDTKPFDLSNLANDKKTQQQLIAWCNTEYRKVRQARFKLEQQWYLNLAFYIGKQNVVSRVTQQADGQKVGTLTTPKAPPWRVRIVVNHVRRYIRKEHAKLVAQKPTAYVVPATSEDSDMFAAEAAEQIWESCYQGKDVAAVMSLAAWWGVWCGSSFVKTWFDETAIDPISKQPGDICYEAVSPFHLLVPDFIQVDIEKQAWVCHISTKDIDWVKANFPTSISGDPIRPNVNSANAIIDSAYINLLNANNLQPNSVLIQEWWFKPNAHRLFPKGGMLTVAGDQVVQVVDGWPYENGNEFPFSKFDHIASGKFYNDSIIVDLIPLQREVNRIHSQLIEAKNRMAKPQLVAARGSVDPKKITSEPGLVILYAPGHQKPEQMVLAQIPSYVMEELKQLMADMDDLVGQHDISTGQAPGGVSAATAIAYLQENDDSILGESIYSLESLYRKIGRQTLSLAAQYWDDERLVKVVGEDGSFDVQQFSASDMADNTDLRVISGSGMPISKAGRTATIMDLMAQGFIQPDIGLDLMQMGGPAGFFNATKIDKRQAQRENIKMRQMPPVDPMEAMMQPPQDPDADGDIDQPTLVQVNTWDNHAVHIQVHNDFRKGQTFETLPDNIKQEFEAHVQMHMAALQGGLPAQPQTPAEPGYPESEQPAEPPMPGGM